MQACKLPDGRYRLFDLGPMPGSRFSDTYGGESDAELQRNRNERVLIKRLGGLWDDRLATFVMPDADSVESLGAEKVFGVVTGPSSCGCEPAGFRWAGESEVQSGRIVYFCQSCIMRARSNSSRCDIIHVCGEADVAEAVYEAEFRASVEV